MLNSIIFFIIIFIIIGAIKIVPTDQEWVVEDLGKKRKQTIKPGFTFLLPGYSYIRAKVSTKEQILNIKISSFNIDNENISISIEFLYVIDNPINYTYFSQDSRESMIYQIRDICTKIIEENHLLNIFEYKNEISKNIKKEEKLIDKDLGILNYIKINAITINDFKKI